MKDLKKFHKHLMKESDQPKYSIDEEVKKDLAKEDALTLVSEFVKDVKKKFPEKKDRLEVLKDVEKTLTFYINEIENTSSIDVMSVVPHDHSVGFDEVGKENFNDDEDSLYGDG